jgi:hypothetical protein
MMAQYLVDLIESKDTITPVKNINSKGIRHLKYPVPTLTVTIA